MKSRDQNGPASGPHLSYRTEIARRLNRADVSAAPLERLPVISIFDDEEYENFDIDFVPPYQRLRVAAVLSESGFRLTSGTTFEPLEGGRPLVFPKAGILGTDPSLPAADLLSEGGSVVLVTPTQALLLYLHRFGKDPAAKLVKELSALVWEQPANLDKVRDWARAAGKGRLYGRLRPNLEEAQAEGIDLRRRRSFRSNLPR